MIESSRTVRFVTTSLVVKAIEVVREVSDNFIEHLMFCMKKTGMTPMAKIFTKLSESAESRKQLV